ncbi:helix-turn-helix transcriptional regulator [Cellulomonas iranensis]|uniref:helix-turn-helix transcriptional regulator n=1 Tax=Cellulomonas iranensis TaxID=76862 RepID=UPI0013D8DE3E|nr:helix-turn-helix domain-containing protein [Cellulomonas iranensis]
MRPIFTLDSISAELERLVASAPASPSPVASGDELLDTAAAAALLGISPSTLAHWRSDGLPCPPAVRLGRRAIRYRREAVLTWAASLERAS